MQFLTGESCLKLNENHCDKKQKNRNVKILVKVANAGQIESKKKSGNGMFLVWKALSFACG